MKKKRLMFLVNEFLNKIESDAGNAQFSLLQQKLLKKHNEDVLWEFLSLPSVGRTDSELVSFDALQKAFKNIWNRTRKTMLSYTALPKAPVTDFLIKIAYETLYENKKNSPPSLIDVLHLIMPTLLLHKDVILYTPEEWGFGIPEAPISALKFPENPKNPETTVVAFLESHLIADSGEYFIPLWALNKIEDRVDILIEKIENFYYEYGIRYTANDARN